MRRRPKMPMGAVHAGHRIRSPRAPWWRLPLLLLIALALAAGALVHFGKRFSPEMVEKPPQHAASSAVIAGAPDAHIQPSVPAPIPIEKSAREKQAPAKKSGARPQPVVVPEEEDFRPRPPRDVFEAQVALTRDDICPGSIDGAWGGQTRAAVMAFQQKHGLRVTAQLDNNTGKALLLTASPLTTYTVTPDDFLRLRPLPKGWLERSTLDRLDFSTVLELVAEKHWSHPSQIERLNPDTNWQNITTGTRLIVPRVFREKSASRPDLIVIHLTAKTLEIFDADSRLVAHFPCSIARRVEKRPVGALEVAVIAENPNYTFNPETFPDSEEAQAIGRKLILQPGPNNPVGVAWIGLNLEGYGIHGSPDPEKIGRTESSGCFRLANWNAHHLLGLVRVGMRVQVEP